MSSSLLKRSLDFFESNKLCPGKKRIKQVDNGGHPFDGVDAQNKKTDSHNNQTKLRKKKRGTSANSLTVDSVRKSLKNQKNKAEENLVRLQALSSSQVDTQLSEKIFKSAVKVKECTVEPKISETAFTEEDFKKFEEEYFVN